MAQLYRITPLEKKSVEYYLDIFEEMPDGSIRGFAVTETWRWGQGFRELDNQVYEHELSSVSCNPQHGWGCELDDLISVQVDFDDEWSDEEKEKIEAILRGESEDEEGRWGTAWLYDGDHNLQIDYDCVNILGPVKIDLVDEENYNEVIEENIKPKVLDPRTSWPWSPDNPRPDDE